jgi:hypothetical protein
MTRPWNEINKFYSSLNSEAGKAMHQLISSIQKSTLEQGLFAWTSVMDLCITQIPVEYPYNGPYLRISPKSDDAFEFRYLDTWDEGKQWHRSVRPSQAFEQLQRFVSDLHWFPSNLLHDPLDLP